MRFKKKPKNKTKNQKLCYYEQNIRWNIYKRKCRLYIKRNICWVLLTDVRHCGQNTLFILVNYHHLTYSYFTKEAIENQVVKHWIRSRTKPLHNIVAIFSKLSRLQMYLLLYGSMCQFQNSLLTMFQIYFIFQLPCPHSFSRFNGSYHPEVSVTVGKA